MSTSLITLEPIGIFKASSKYPYEARRQAAAAMVRRADEHEYRRHEPDVGVLSRASASEELMSKLRVSSFAVSIDGYGAGTNQDLANPRGVGGPALMEWLFSKHVAGDRATHVYLRKRM